ncbi:MAG: hypothetical protein UY76_C0008G0015 [Candidatus Uhrbacteria bacterium GW2011_GWA2_52_8d]|uniref:Uncharacterized protein n=1 Tax=Candidatus Uhrbacteria bacterium GW2011_GWA2_52_8d TaxID=1618979 RepID=A0A0G1ZXL0_9BACT|nr:MAG: hypothetical protein UY76_C0008G0015 [Candidatus Uhrbacteria bacterium GW2011_GWA2_52_8d]
MLLRLLNGLNYTQNQSNLPTMPHPHQSMLDEFQYAIKHFVPSLPNPIKAEAQRIHDDLVQNEALDEAAIKRTFYTIGIKEYPYRRAFQELTSSTAEEMFKNMVIEHVDETVRGVIKPHLDEGVSMEALISSELFTESLNVKQRYQVEDGILVAKDKLAEILKNRVGEQAQLYQGLVEKWTREAEKIQEAIAELEKLGQGGDETQQAEIKNKVERFREGFLVTEQDPELELVQKEIEYWRDTFAQEE